MPITIQCVSSSAHGSPVSVSFTSVVRKSPTQECSTAVPLTSPSPRALCGSPVKTWPPGWNTGRYRVEPEQRSRTSMLPPKVHGGVELCTPVTGGGASSVVPMKTPLPGATAMVPGNGRAGTRRPSEDWTTCSPPRPVTRYTWVRTSGHTPAGTSGGISAGTSRPVSPGSAPSTWTGPVSTCPPYCLPDAIRSARVSQNPTASGRTASGPAPKAAKYSAGWTSWVAPWWESRSTRTVWPERMVRAGSQPIGTPPRCRSSGVASRWWSRPRPHPSGRPRPAGGWSRPPARWGAAQASRAVEAPALAERWSPAPFQRRHSAVASSESS